MQILTSQVLTFVASVSVVHNGSSTHYNAISYFFV